VKLLSPHDSIYLPPNQGKCPACGGGLFAAVHTYFLDGKPVKEAVHIGCADCDSEIADSVGKAARRWVSENYRVKT
jgi:hypothetical protein